VADVTTMAWDSLPLGWVDLALGLLLLVSVIVGLVRGFVFEVLSLAGWFVAFFAARWAAPQIGPSLPVGEPGSTLNHGAAFALVFVLVLLVWALASRLMRALLHATPLSMPDRLLGAGFGFLRGSVMVLAIATLVGFTPAADAAAWRTSRIAGWAAIAIEGLRPLLPESTARRLPAV
jgi:membrane protein required for colicin V production